MALLYADEDFHYAVVECLRHLGHDVLTVQEAGRQSGPDTQVLADATAVGRAVLTFNRRHFKRLQRQNSTHSPLSAAHQMRIWTPWRSALTGP